MKGLHKGFPKGVIAISLAQLVNRIGDFVIPFLSLYLVTYLGYDLSAASVIVSISIAIQSIGALIGGVLADYFGRKNIYSFFQTLFALIILACGLIQNKSAVTLLLLCSTFCSSIVKPQLSSMIYDELAPEDRKRGYTLLYFCANLGVSIGPIIASFLFNRYIQILFIGDAVSSIIAVLIVFYFVKAKTSNDMQNSIKLEKHRLSIVTNGFFLFFILFFLFNFIYSQNGMSLQLTLKSNFNAKGTAYYGYLMSINALSVVILTPFISLMTKKLDLLINITLSGVFYAIGFGMIFISNSFFLFVISTILWSSGEILFATNSGVFVANQCDSSVRSRYNSMLIVLSNLGRSTGVFVMGQYANVNGIHQVWPVIFALGLLLSIATLKFKSSIKKAC